MLTISWQADAFRAAKVPSRIAAELRLRRLPQPTFDLATRTWMWGDDEAGLAAVSFLRGARLATLDSDAAQRVAEMEQAAHLPTTGLRLQQLEARMRSYQQEGVTFILERQRVLLADAVGLGKSLQALVAVEKAGAYPCIVVAPAAVKLGWQREALKWTPWRTVQVVATGREALTGADFTVLNPELLGGQLERLRALQPKSVVLDEAHFFKNPGAQRSRHAMQLVAGVPLRLALTGTPIKNRRVDLLHQLRILGQLEAVLGVFRGLLPHWWKPAMGPIAEVHAVAALEGLDAKTLNERLRQVCMIRRTKDEVAADLPAITRTRIDARVQDVELERRQDEVREWVRKWQASFGDQATRMEGTARLQLHAALTAMRRQAALAKLPAAREWAQELADSGERVVFFAYHRDVVRRLAAALPGRVAVITGDDPAPARRAILDALDNYDFLVATMDAAGYGVDGIQLHASHVAFIELDWTPTKHEQCEGRLHRIGQTAHVNSWYFVAAGSLDATMMEILESKWGDIQGVVEGRDDEGFLDEMVRRIGQG